MVVQRCSDPQRKPLLCETRLSASTSNFFTGQPFEFCSSSSPASRDCCHLHVCPVLVAPCLSLSLASPLSFVEREKNIQSSANPFSNLFSNLDQSFTVWPPQLLTNLFYRQKTAWLLWFGKGKKNSVTLYVTGCHDTKCRSSGTKCRGNTFLVSERNLDHIILVLIAYSIVCLGSHKCTYSKEHSETQRGVVYVGVGCDKHREHSEDKTRVGESRNP
jgi:hypothetical protein